MKKTPIFLLSSIIVIIIVALTIYLNLNKPKNYKIAVLNYSPAAEHALPGLVKGLSSNGYTQGKNLEIVYNGYFKDKNLLKEEGKRLLLLKPDLIYSMSTPATLVMKELTAESQIPVIFGPVSNPAKVGIVKEMKVPGGNITGVTFGPQEPLRLEMLLKFIPDLNDILVPYNPNDKSPVIGVKLIKETAKRLGVNIHTIEVTSVKELKSKLNGYNGSFDAIFVPTDSILVSQTPYIAQYAISKNIPFTCPQREGVKAGALFSYGFSIEDVGMQAARLVHMVLSGTDPGSIPIELSDFTLSINLKTSEDIGIEIPNYLLKNTFLVRE